MTASKTIAGKFEPRLLGNIDVNTTGEPLVPTIFYVIVLESIAEITKR